MKTLSSKFNVRLCCVELQQRKKTEDNPKQLYSNL